MDRQLQQEATTVLEVVEDAVEHICNEYMLSGEKVWTMIGSLSNYKLSEFPIDEEDQIDWDADNEEDEDYD